MTDKEDTPPPRLVALDGDGEPADPPEGAAVPEGANDEALMMRLNELQQEHRDLDTAIETLEERMPYDRLTIQRLKKKKLQLKDDIVRLQDQLWPDIIA